MFAACVKPEFQVAKTITQKDSIAIWEKAFGDEHPRVATGLNNLAMLYGSQRQYAQAESYFKRAIVIWKKSGDAKSLATAAKNLSHLYAETGRTKEAEVIARSPSTSSNGDKQPANVVPAVTVILPRR